MTQDTPLPPKPQPRVITITQVAEEAGVSVATAARVMRSDSYPVSAALKERVRQAAQTLGYVPNLVARTLRGGGGKSLGLIVGDMDDPYFGKIAAVITTQAYQSSVLAVVANMQRDPELEVTMCRKLLEHRVNAIVLAGGSYDQASRHAELQAMIANLAEAQVTVVSLSERGLDVPCFSVDNDAIGRDLAAQLDSLGHRRIAVAAGPAGGTAMESRLSGLRQALAEDATLLAVHTDLTHAGAGEVIERLKIDDEDRPTVIVAFSDGFAVDIMRRLQERGIDVPGDMSIVSVGNTAYCDISKPRLTSIDIAIERNCKAAVHYLEAMWQGNPAPAIPGEAHHIVWRESLGPAKNS